VENLTAFIFISGHLRNDAVYELKNYQF